MVFHLTEARTFSDDVSSKDSLNLPARSKNHSTKQDRNQVMTISSSTRTLQAGNKAISIDARSASSKRINDCHRPAPIAKIDFRLHEPEALADHCMLKEVG